MKAFSAREFYRNAGLVDGLPERRQRVGMANGKAKIVVRKIPGPRMTRKLAEERAVGCVGEPKFDSTAFLVLLKK
jgi:hypothetical protein